MDNNDRLIRLRYALDIKDTDMVDIFKLGGITITKEHVRKMLIKSKDAYDDERDDLDLMEEKEENLTCTNSDLDAFLNGFITFKRGKQDTKQGQVTPPTPSIKNGEGMNNILLKKVKVALSLTSEDMLDIFKIAGIHVTKGELGALFRKEGHKHYKVCGDKYARYFLKGLARRYRK